MSTGNQESGIATHGKKNGILSTLLNYLHRNRIGELMVVKGLISPKDLQSALSMQKETGRPLGHILIENNVISTQQLYGTLGCQLTMRTIATFVFCFVSFTHIGGKKARADRIQDIPAVVKPISLSKEFTAMSYYPALLGSSEKRSTSLKAFDKWSGMFARFNSQMKSSRAQKSMEQWYQQVQAFKGMSLNRMAEKVNSLVNEKRYILDQNNWGKSDYWATPVEFIERGGDCEDFAIAKYTALRALGVPEERLRLAIVHDKEKNIPHAILIVYTDNGPILLDNQYDNVKNAANFRRYRAIYSINRTAWWLHSKPSSTLIASAD